MDLMYLMQVGGLTVTAFIFYRLMVRERKDKTKGHYTRPAWNFFLKKIYAEYTIRRRQKRDKKRLIQENEKRYECEAPKILPTEESSDSQLICGHDDKRNSILIKFTRRRHRVAEIWLLLKLANGQTYTFPDHPNTKVVNATPRVFEGSGLKLECLAPYSKWRISYSGMLRRGIAQNVSDDEEEFYYAKFNFIWTTASDPAFWPQDWSPKLIATSLATEQWRDGKWMHMMVKKDSGGYDQFGACHGEVKIYDKDSTSYVDGFSPKMENFELNLPGIRQRRWGQHKNEHLHRTGVLIGCIKDGCVFEVGAISSKYGLTHSQFGNVRFPDSNVFPIDKTDFNLASLGEYQNHLPEATIVQIEAGTKKFNVVVNFKNNAKIPLCGGSRKESWNAFIIPIEIKFNTEIGSGVAIFWYPKNLREFDIQEIPTKIRRIFNRTDFPNADKLVVSFAEKAAESVLVSGGKGSSIAILRTIQETNGKDFLDKRGRGHEMLNALVDQVSSNPLKRSLRVQNLMKVGEPRRARKRAGSIAQTIFPDPHDFDVPEYHVPQGFIVSVSAVEQHLTNNPKIRSFLNELEDVAYEKTSGDLKDACEKVQAAFESSILGTQLKELLAPKLNQINFDGSARFAVRSSGVTEDGEESSAAGQNETFLGLKKNENVFDAVVKCWASLYSFQSVQYRKQHIQPVVSSMAVVVQKMVAAESAGVLFSRHPLNGDPSVIVITANYGLGESVVSARAEPDTFYIKRSYKDDLKILGSKAGEKRMLIEMDDETSVKEVTLDDNKRNRFCLSEEVALKLAKLGVIMEKFFGTPRDIEFAVTSDNRIYLLQSRPITALNNFTEYELVHDNDSAFMTDTDICTKGNVGEVVLGSFSRFSQANFLFEKVMHKDLAKPYSGLYQMFLPYSHQHLFMGMNSNFLANVSSRDVGMLGRVGSMSIFGCDVFEKYPEIIDAALHRNAFKVSKDLSQLLLMFKGIFMMDKYMKDINETCAKVKAKFSQDNLNKLKHSSDVWDLIEKSFDDLEVASLSHSRASRNSVIFQLMAFSILVHKSKSLTRQHQSDIATILGSISNVESANVPEMIKEIAGKILLMNKHEGFIKVDRKEAVAWLSVHCSSAHDLFEAFIKRHGHRSINELDFIAKPWSMEQEMVVDMIKSNLLVGGSITNKDSRAKSDDEIIENLKTPLGKIAKIFMRKLLPKCQRSVQGREETKSKIVFVVNEIRRGVIYLGQMLVNEGFLPDKELIFHLSNLEIKDLIASRNGKLVAKAIRRQKLIPKLNDLKFPELSFGFPRAMTKQHHVLNSSEGDVLVQGVPVCGGIVTGNACVCKSFADVNKIQKGDILITYGTDIGWSPYFPILGGICTEIGGLISHGAVVAREYGLPCIVGASFATDKIKHGQKVTLNADDGTITAAS